MTSKSATMSPASSPLATMRSVGRYQDSEAAEALKHVHEDATSSQGQFPPPQEPFPALETRPEFQCNASLHALDTSGTSQVPASPSIYTPITGLRIHTDHLAQKNRADIRSISSEAVSETSQPTVFNAGLPVRHSSIRSSHSARNRRSDSLSPGSNITSPSLGPLVDMTPLPSPISTWGSPAPDQGQWRRSIDEDGEDTAPGAQYTPTSSELGRPYLDYGRTSPKKRKIPLLNKMEGFQPAQNTRTEAAAHARNRSLSDYTPEGMQVPKSRNIAVSSSIAPPLGQQFSPPNDQMHREPYLAVQRGIAVTKPPTPPDSNTGRLSDDLERPASPPKLNSSVQQYYEAKSLQQGKLKKWRPLRQLGEGQFSKVMLATSDLDMEVSVFDPIGAETKLDPKSLVAVKVCNHGPAGGADEKSIQTSITRELELMKSFNHPSLVHLKAVSQQDRQTLFVLNYCPGGDLFDLASTKLSLLKPSLVRRIFSELVAAVQCLHTQFIVHRDIKLESRCGFPCNEQQNLCLLRHTRESSGRRARKPN